MNKRPFLDKSIQYGFYLYSIKPKKRYTKWSKQTKDESLQLIQKHYNISLEKAQTYLQILTEEQIEEIKRLSDHGGMKKKI